MDLQQPEEVHDVPLSILDLSLDVWGVITRSLASSDVASLICTCRGLRDLLADDALWEPLYTSHYK